MILLQFFTHFSSHPRCLLLHPSKTCRSRSDWPTALTSTSARKRQRRSRRGCGVRFRWRVRVPRHPPPPRLLLSRSRAERKAPTEDDYLKLWKALFYTVWHSDKVPVQQELVLNLARLVRAVAADENRIFLFLSSFFATMRREWMGIDKHRIDKYLSLLRRVLEEALRLSLPSAADAAGGTPARASRLGALLHDAVMTRRPNGIRFHVCEVFLDEVCAAAPDAATPELLLVLEPFLAQARMTDDAALFERVTKDVLGGLLERVEAAQRGGEGSGGEGSGDDDAEDDDDAVDAAAATESASSEDEGGDGAAPSQSSRGGDGSSSHAATDLVVDIALLRSHQDQRRRNAARALRRVNLAPLAQRIFAIASDKGTKPTHREALYALHARFAAAARALKHATRDDELFPAGALVPLGAGSAAPAAPAVAAAAAGTKRQRADAASADVPLLSKSSLVAPRAAAAAGRGRTLGVSDDGEDEGDGDEDADDDAEEDEEDVPLAAPQRPSTRHLVAAADRRGGDAPLLSRPLPPRAKQGARAAPQAPRAAPSIATELLAIPPVAALLQQQQQPPVATAAQRSRKAQSADAGKGTSGKAGKGPARPAEQRRPVQK